MDFFDNVVNKSNAIIKERLNNPFGGGGSSTSKLSDQQQAQQSGDQQLVQGVEVDENTVLVAATSDGPAAGQQAFGPKQASQDSATAGGDGDKRDSQFANIAADAEAVAQKAAKGAQKFGNFLFSMANKAGQTVSQTAKQAGHTVSQTAKQAGQTVSQTAKQVKQAVESTSILTDLTREQQEFVREHGGSLQAGELPWQSESDDTKAAYVREQILSLSQDKRNFVRAPPNESDFRFDPQTCYPIALSLLKEDPNLNKMRGELVPKLVNEETFWCNYFYRVSMLKQMSEKGTDAKKGWASSRSSSGEGPDEVTASMDAHQPAEQPHFSPTYDTAAPQAANQQDSFSLVDADNEARGREPTTPTSSYARDTLQQQQQQDQYPANDQEPYDQSNGLESSESRKLVAEADDLKSKLRELNIGSLDFDQDAPPSSSDTDEDFRGSLQEFELVSSDVSAFDEEASNDEFRLQFRALVEAPTGLGQLKKGEEADADADADEDEEVAAEAHDDYECWPVR